MTVVLARGYNGPDGVGPPDMMTTPVDGRWRLVIAYRLEHGFLPVHASCPTVCVHGLNADLLLPLLHVDRENL